MRNARQWAALMAAAVAFSALAGTHAMAGQDAISIDMTNYNDEAWANIAMANDDTVETGVNIRKSAEADGEVVGFLYRGGAVNVLYRGDTWSEVSSGNVTGYIKNEYLTYGAEAKGLAEHYGSYGVKTSWDDVNVFSGESGNASIVKTAKDGETFRLVGKNGDWMQVQAGADSSAYVPAEDVSLVMVVDSAIAVDEVDDGSSSVFTDLAYAGAPQSAAPAGSESGADVQEASNSYETSSSETASYDASDANVTDAASVSYDAGAVDTSYETDDGSAVYEQSAQSAGTESASASGDASAASYSAAQVSTSGTAQELQSQANALYQQYLDAQAAADAAVANGAGEQAINDTAAAAVAAYNTFLQAQNAADAAAWGSSVNVQSTGSADSSSQESAQVQTEASVQEPAEEQTGMAVEDTSAEETQPAEDTSGSSSQASASDLELLAALIYCEAGNQPYEGQVAVGAVVMNRVKSSAFPNTVYEVINQSGQFTPSYSGVLAQALANGSGAGYIGAASDAMAGVDPTGGLLYFNNHRGSGLQIGDHWFY